MKRFATLLVVALLAGGCATKEGIRLPSGSGPTKENAEEFNKRNSTASTPPGLPSTVPADAVVTAQIPDPDGPRMIIIGNVMALTVFDDATLSSRYDVYLKQVQSRSAIAGFTREWYMATSAGETAVKFTGVTGLYSRFFKAEIPKDLIRQISFASAFGTFMVGTSGDLVSAERSAKNGTWVTRVLCSEKSADFASCESRYPRGIYQSSDGREIDDKLVLVAGGKSIDPVSYTDSALKIANKPAPQPLVAPASLAKEAVAPVQSTASASVAPAVSGGAAKDVTAQLEKLNELRSRGLVTEAEYQQKRKQILDSL